VSDDLTPDDVPSDDVPSDDRPVGPGHERLAEDVAGYVLGGLTLDEQQAFEAHLAVCPACRHELAQLDPIPVLLDLSSSPTPAPGSPPEPAWGDDRPPAPSPTPGAEPEAEPEAEPAAAGPRRRRRLVAVGSAVAVLAVAAAFLIGLMVASPTEPGYSQAVALRPATTPAGITPVPEASGQVAVRTVDHGTEVRLEVHGLPSTGAWYECLWWSADGVRSAGTFRVPGGGATDVELTTAAELRPGWRLAILEHRGRTAAPVTVLETSA
jgi:Putative zinc-finger